MSVAGLIKTGLKRGSAQGFHARRMAKLITLDAHVSEIAIRNHLHLAPCLQINTQTLPAAYKLCGWQVGLLFSLPGRFARQTMDVGARNAEVGEIAV